METFAKDTAFGTWLSVISVGRDGRDIGCFLVHYMRVGLVLSTVVYHIYIRKTRVERVLSIVGSRGLGGCCPLYDTQGWGGDCSSTDDHGWDRGLLSSIRPSWMGMGVSKGQHQ